MINGGEPVSSALAIGACFATARSELEGNRRMLDAELCVVLAAGGAVIALLVVIGFCKHTSMMESNKKVLGGQSRDLQNWWCELQYA